MNNSDQLVVGVIGAGGFIGAHLVPVLSAKAGLDIRLLQNRRELNYPRCSVYSGDIHVVGSLSEFMSGCDLLINLAHPVIGSDDGSYERAITGIARAAREASVSRVLHLSTAMVAGSPRVPLVDENTFGPALTLYERHKRAAEAIFLSELLGVTDVGILRPTAVFGEGGLNLLKLIRTVHSSQGGRRNLLRFFHGQRRLHLVSVRDVISAILFLAFLRRPLSGNAFIVSSDAHALNTYQAVDNVLGEALGKPAVPTSPCLPTPLLRLVLTMLGKTQTDPTLVFSSDKLAEWGWHSEVDFGAEIRAFAKAWHRREAKQ